MFNMKSENSQLNFSVEQAAIFEGQQLNTLMTKHFLEKTSEAKAPKVSSEYQTKQY